MTRAVAIAAALASFAASFAFATAAHAEPPCAGCRLSLPAGDAPAPLLVVLHGDHQPTQTPHDAWTRLATKRGVGVLTLACPKDLGCKGSYWQWAGDPAWVKAQVAKVEGTRAVDRDRLWLVGWSGGATWMGMNAQTFARDFAAMVVHGGGVPPADTACEAPKTPVYFLVGDKNPLHYLSVRLRDHDAACGADLTWDLVRGADHGGEWAALPSHGAAIMNWLLAHPRATS